MVIEVQQIEGEVGEGFVGAFLKGGLQVRKAGRSVVGENDDFTVEDCGRGGNISHLFRDLLHAMSPVQTSASQKLYTRSVLPGLNAVAVELQFVEPARTARRTFGRERQFRCDEAWDPLSRRVGEGRSRPGQCAWFSAGRLLSDCFTACRQGKFLPGHSEFVVAIPRIAVRSEERRV